LALILGRPLRAYPLQLGVVDDFVDRAHVVHLLRGVGTAQEEDLTANFWPT